MKTMSDQVNELAEATGPSRYYYYIICVLLVPIYFKAFAPQSVRDYLHLPAQRAMVDAKSAGTATPLADTNSSKLSPRALELVADSYYRLNRFDSLRKRWMELAVPIMSSRQWFEEKSGSVADLLVQGNLIAQDFEKTKETIDELCSLTITSEIEKDPRFSPDGDVFGQVDLRQQLDQHIRELTEAIKRLEAYIESGTLPSQVPL